MLALKLHRGNEVTPDLLTSGVDAGVMLCRQSRLGGVVQALVLGLAFGGAPCFAWWLGAPRFVTGIGAMIGVPVVLFLWGDVRLRFRPTNWVLLTSRDRLLVNLRSYQDRGPDDIPSVVELALGEIDEVRRFTDRYSVPNSKGGNTRYRLDSLEILLRAPDDGSVAAAIAALRRRRQPERRLLGLIRSRSAVTVNSVSLPRPDCLRIAWWGGQGHALSPGLKRILAQLAQQVPLGAAYEKGDDSATDQEVDERILGLVESGNHLDAVKLLVHHRGYTLTQAKRFVDELSADR